MPDGPTAFFATADDWERWLEREHATATELWLKIAKKSAAIPSVSYPEAVEAALCFGWIDGQSARLDDEYWLQRFTPRRPRSPWSKINRERAEALAAQGRMRPAGLREIERARADGRWDAAYQPPSTSTVPEDLQRALDANEAARRFFATLNSTNRYAILHRIETAKRAETRARRIATYLEMLEEGRTIYPQHRRDGEAPGQPQPA